MTSNKTNQYKQNKIENRKWERKRILPYTHAKYIVQQANKRTLSTKIKYHLSTYKSNEDTKKILFRFLLHESMHARFSTRKTINTILN